MATELTLEAIRGELAEAELDDGLVVFGTLMSLTAVGLVLLVQLVTVPHGSKAVVVLLPALALIGHVVRRWRRAQLHQRLETRFGLSYAILEKCAELSGLDPELKDVVSHALGVSITINRLAHHRRWAAMGVDLTGDLAAVRDSLLAVLAQARAAQQVAALVEVCETNLRRPDRLSALRARLDERRQELGEVLESLEEVLVELSEALAAAIDHPSEAAEIRDRLTVFSDSMARLTRSFESLDDVEDDERVLTR